MSEARVCAKCGSKGPFSLISDGLRCGACGDVQPVAVPARYEQPADPPGRASDPRKAHWRNPLGM